MQNFLKYFNKLGNIGGKPDKMLPGAQKNTLFSIILYLFWGREFLTRIRLKP